MSFAEHKINNIETPAKFKTLMPHQNFTALHAVLNLSDLQTSSQVLRFFTWAGINEETNTTKKHLILQQGIVQIGSTSIIIGL